MPVKAAVDASGGPQDQAATEAAGRAGCRAGTEPRKYKLERADTAGKMEDNNSGCVSRKCPQFSVPGYPGIC